MKKFSELTDNDKIYTYTPEGNTGVYFVSKIFPGIYNTDISVIPADEKSLPINYMLTVPSDLSWDSISRGDIQMIVTCEPRVMKLIYEVIRYTKTSIGIQLNNLFGNVFKTNI